MIDENDLISPHEKGTLRILEHAKKNSVSRIIMTSSVASVLSQRSSIAVLLPVFPTVRLGMNAAASFGVVGAVSRPPPSLTPA